MSEKNLSLAIRDIENGMSHPLVKANASIASVLFWWVPCNGQPLSLLSFMKTICLRWLLPFGGLLKVIYVVPSVSVLYSVILYQDFRILYMIFEISSVWELYSVVLMLCMICYHLCNLKNLKNTHGGGLLVVTLVKITLPHGCFLRF